MKKYRVIAKVEKDKFVKYKVNNLIMFTKFLDRKFSGWRWFNVYEYNKSHNGKQLASFTSNNKPRSKYIQIT